MPKLFSYYTGNLEEFIDIALTTKDCLLKRIISTVSPKLIDDLREMNLIIDESYRHTLDNNAIRHITRIHGAQDELLRGQIPISKHDIMLIPTVITSYDSINLERNKRNQAVIVYSKTIEDGISIYVEKLRLGRHELAACTMYKRKKENSPTQID